MPDCLIRFNGVVFRAHNPKWAFKPDSGEGAARVGGRFNPKGVPALYTSLTQIGALLEAQQGFSLKAQPNLICAYQVNTHSVADLTDQKTLIYFDIDLKKLSCAWLMEKNPYTHQVMNQLVKRGVSAVIVPSFAKGAESIKNLVFWKWSNRQPYQVEVIDDYNRLPKNQNSWL